MWRVLGSLWILLMLCACVNEVTPLVDQHVQAVAQDSRVRFVVLHYTSENDADSLHILTRKKVSSHYLITRQEPVQVYKLVDENRRAWHAGASQWYGYPNLNAMSIGIEIVNPGHVNKVGMSQREIPQNRRDWEDYSEQQIHRLIPLLKDIIERHKINPRNVVAHSDIAPQRKVDPGPTFPWQRLAQEGIGRWYDPYQVQVFKTQLQHRLPDAGTVQKQLAAIGYEIVFTGRFDEQTANVIRAFQLHYRPANFQGRLDVETAAILADIYQQSLK